MKIANIDSKRINIELRSTTNMCQLPVESKIYSVTEANRIICHRNFGGYRSTDSILILQNKHNLKSVELHDEQWRFRARGNSISNCIQIQSCCD
jgi:hypothetical protein